MHQHPLNGLPNINPPPYALNCVEGRINSNAVQKKHRHHHEPVDKVQKHLSQLWTMLLIDANMVVASMSRTAAINMPLSPWFHHQDIEGMKNKAISRWWAVSRPSIR